MAFLINGLLLAFKEAHDKVGPAARIPGALAAAITLCSYVITVRRQRVLARVPAPVRLTPRGSVYVVGIAALVLIVVTTIAQLI